MLFYHLFAGLTGGPVKGAADKGRRNKKAEAAAQAAAEHARKYGICCIPLRMAPFFAGEWNSTPWDSRIII